jgi:methylenetetrahydrofolate dehydrogenase (NADP+)/methenyltetrahydrofolate cyclohydrolase
VLRRDVKKSREKIRAANIVISACGRPGMIRGDMVKKGAMIIDGGITKKRNKVFGDADFGSVKNVVGYLSPVPGGVGPVTIACLLENVYLASKKQSK